MSGREYKYAGLIDAHRECLQEIADSHRLKIGEHVLDIIRGVSGNSIIDASISDHKTLVEMIGHAAHTKKNLGERLTGFAGKGYWAMSEAGDVEGLAAFNTIRKAYPDPEAKPVSEIIDELSNFRWHRPFAPRPSSPTISLIHTMLDSRTVKQAEDAASASPADLYAVMTAVVYPNASSKEAMNVISCILDGVRFQEIEPTYRGWSPPVRGTTLLDTRY